jgi:hypothetical protein
LDRLDPQEGVNIYEDDEARVYCEQGILVL